MEVVYSVRIRLLDVWYYMVNLVFLVVHYFTLERQTTGSDYLLIIIHSTTDAHYRTWPQFQFEDSLTKQYRITYYIIISNYIQSSYLHFSSIFFPEIYWIFSYLVYYEVKNFLFYFPYTPSSIRNADTWRFKTDIRLKFYGSISMQCLCCNMLHGEKYWGIYLTRNLISF